MEIVFEAIKAIPKLAWAAQIERGANSVTVRHGECVETGTNFFVEGAWAGDFEDRHFESQVLMGSGGKTSNGKLVLACPNHTLDRIYVYLDNNRFVAANSLPFLLSLLDDELDPSFLFYDAHMASIIDGIDKYERYLPTKAGRQVQLFYHSNLYVDTDLGVESRPKPALQDFDCYQDYVDFLADQISAICSNAADASRSVSYLPLATISSGYDSPACAVFARNVGCQSALTFAEARGESADDSGHLIAGKLGLEAKTVDRLAYMDRPDFPEAECSGGPSEFSSLVDDLEGTILFVGFNGDKVWDRFAPPNTSIVRGDASGFGLTELRLRVGFILMAVPFIGCTSHPSIHKISNSMEMQPWSLNNRYDRPIPRRLVEENGVPREWFGVNKRAAGIYVTEEGIENTMSPASQRDFTDFCDRHWRRSFAIQSHIIAAAHEYSRFNKRINRGLGRLTPDKYRTLRVPNILPRKLRIRTYGYTGRDALLFHWGVEKMLARYAPAN